MKMWIERALAHPIQVAVVAAVCACAAFVLLLSTQVDNALEVWLVKDSDQYATYREFVDTFGSEEFIAVVLHGEGMVEPEGLAVLGKATRAAEAIQGIQSCLSPATLQKKMKLSDRALKNLLLSVPAYRGFLVSEDGMTAGLFLTIDPGAAQRPEIVRNLTAALSFVEGTGFSLHLGGPPVLNAELNRLSAEDPRILFPIVFAVTILLLLFLFRTLAGVLVPLAVVMVTVLVTLAGVTLAGRQLNMITVGFPTVLWVLMMSQSIHLLTAYSRERDSMGGRGSADGRGQRHQGAEGREAVMAAIRHIAYPCLLMSVTTAAGFLSLLFSKVEPVRELGVYTAAGILFGFVVNLVLGPALLLLKARGLAVKRAHRKIPFNKLVAFIGKSRFFILGLCFVMMGLSIHFATKIEVETNALRFLKEDNHLQQDYAFIHEHLVGLASLEIDLERGAEESLAQVLEKISRFKDRVTAAHPECRVLSVDDFLKGGAFFLSQGEEALAEADLETLQQQAHTFFDSVAPSARALLLAGFRLTTDMDPYISKDDGRVRISIFSPAFEGSEFESFSTDIQKIAMEIFTDRAQLTGIIPLLVVMQEYLVESQVQCLAAALVIIFLFMLFAARSLKLGLLAMIPNLFPIVVNFGVMGLIGVRLDAATMMIASVAMGIAVDNTIHVIVAFRNLKGDLEKTLAWKGEAILYTTLVTCCGFLVLSFSIFLPMGWFGKLTGLTIFWAMAGDLFVLPALLWKKR